MYQLANCYLNGVGCDADPKKGVQTLKKAIKKGNSKAMNLLGLCYLNGNGAKKNFDAAIEYFKKAADDGNKDAIENLKNYSKEDKENNNCVSLKTDENNKSLIVIDEQKERINTTNSNSNIPLIKVASANTVHYLNDSLKLPIEHSSQRIPESSRFVRPPSKDNRNPRINQRLNPVVNRQQKERSQPIERSDAPKKLTRRVMFGPMPPLLQKSRSGRRTINQTVQGQYRI